MKNIISICFIIMLIIYGTGCGQTNQATGNVENPAYVSRVDNPSVDKFNKMLGGISDEASAENTVNAFVGYVDTKIIKTGMSIQSGSSSIRPELIKRLAAKEAAARRVGSKLFSDGQAGEPMLDIGTVTDNINELGSDQGIRVSDDTISTVKAVTEASMPNMNKENDPGMTPLEAMVIGYAVVSGDDGTATDESVAIPEDKMNSYVENITQ